MVHGAQISERPSKASNAERGFAERSEGTGGKPETE